MDAWLAFELHILSAMAAASGQDAWCPQDHDADTCTIIMMMMSAGHCVNSIHDVTAPPKRHAACIDCGYGIGCSARICTSEVLVDRSTCKSSTTLEMQTDTKVHTFQFRAAIELQACLRYHTSLKIRYQKNQLVSLCKSHHCPVPCTRISWLDCTALAQICAKLYKCKAAVQCSLK